MTESTRWPETRAARGLVASPHRLASEAGVAALRVGGNAVDAATAAAATIAVVHPHMNGVGGDNFWLIYDAAHRRLAGLNAAGRSAAAANLTSYRSRFGDWIPTRGGPAALTGPGAVSGWRQAHRYSSRTMGSPVTWPPHPHPVDVPRWRATAPSLRDDGRRRPATDSGRARPAPRRSRSRPEAAVEAPRWLTGGSDPGADGAALGW